MPGAEARPAEGDLRNRGHCLGANFLARLSCLSESDLRRRWPSSFIAPFYSEPTAASTFWTPAVGHFHFRLLSLVILAKVVWPAIFCQSYLIIKS